jgi:hypothetical protein
VVVEAGEQPREGGGADRGGGVERVGLAGAGLADHHLHPRPGAGEPPDHLHLLDREGPPTDGEVAVTLVGDGDAGVVPVEGAGDGALLGQQQPLRGVAALVDLGRHDPPIGPAVDVDAGELPAGRAELDEQVGVVGQERVCGPLDELDRRAGRELTGQLLQHLTAAERRRRLGQLLLDDQPVPQPGELGPLPRGPFEQLLMPAELHTGFPGAVGPALAQLRLRGPFALGLPGGERRGLRRRSGRFAPRRHVGDDLSAPAGESRSGAGRPRRCPPPR